MYNHVPDADRVFAGAKSQSVSTGVRAACGGAHSVLLRKGMRIEEILLMMPLSVRRNKQQPRKIVRRAS